MLHVLYGKLPYKVLDHGKLLEIKWKGEETTKLYEPAMDRAVTTETYVSHQQEGSL